MSWNSVKSPATQYLCQMWEVVLFKEKKIILRNTYKMVTTTLQRRVILPSFTLKKYTVTKNIRGNMWAFNTHVSPPSGIKT